MARKKVTLPVPCTSSVLKSLDFYDELCPLIRADLVPHNDIIRNNNDLLQIWLRNKEERQTGNFSAPLTRTEFVKAMEAICDAIEGARTATAYSNFDGRP